MDGIFLLDRERLSFLTNFGACLLLSDVTAASRKLQYCALMERGLMMIVGKQRCSQLTTDGL